MENPAGFGKAQAAYRKEQDAYKVYVPGDYERYYKTSFKSILRLKPDGATATDADLAFADSVIKNGIIGTYNLVIKVEGVDEADKATAVQGLQENKRLYGNAYPKRLEFELVAPQLTDYKLTKWIVDGKEVVKPTVAFTLNKNSEVTAVFEDLRVPPVLVPVTAIEVSVDNTLLSVNDTVQASAVVSPEDATDQTVVWTSSNPAVATVDAATGLITAVSAGTADIIATSGDILNSLTITVIPAGDLSIVVTGKTETTVAIEFQTNLGKAAYYTATIRQVSSTYDLASKRIEPASELLTAAVSFDNLKHSTFYTVTLTDYNAENAVIGTRSITFETEKGVGNEAIAANAQASVSYADGILTLTNLDGTTAAIVSLNGKTAAKFTVSGNEVQKAVALAPGFYILNAGKTVSKFIVR
ncbi:Bacterial Ig-like domain (group 2) [Bacteroidales bacterium Barb4]|nr:Bacterial Ig-like domain (group 2) [Bacteroidales bacterium Barb4]